jgi:hypothetical protein
MRRAMIVIIFIAFSGCIQYKVGRVTLRPSFSSLAKKINNKRHDKEPEEKQVKRKTRIAKKTPVYTSYTSKIYHKKGCRQLVGLDTIKFNSREEIQKEGGTACTICNP